LWMSSITTAAFAVSTTTAKIAEHPLPDWDPLTKGDRDLSEGRTCTAARSTPHASEQATDLATNTTGHLIADLELLRTHLGIERWRLFDESHSKHS